MADGSVLSLVLEQTEMISVCHTEAEGQLRVV